MKNAIDRSSIMGGCAPADRCAATTLRNQTLRAGALILLACLCRLATAQTGDWTWMGGSQTRGQPGVYGTLGTPAAGNIPGARQNATNWTDSNGNFWLFGGIGYDTNGNSDYLNDLWEFDPSTNQWAWMGGSSTLISVNGSNYFALGVYGTLGVPAAGNTPGSRSSSAGWTDSSGNLWLFGGYGNSSAFNDLWEFNPKTNEWAWMGGSALANGCYPGSGEFCWPPGVYGTLGVPAAGNIPGGRSGASAWTDSSGNFWLFGGYGLDAIGNWATLNDLWEFDPSTNEWAWMGGRDLGDPCWAVPVLCGQHGVYGTLGVPAAGNIPGGRSDASAWTDSSGNLWLFGGDGLDANGAWGLLNDLWEIDPSTDQWTWMGGNSTLGSNRYGPHGVYGTLGVPAAGNIPGSRYSASAWTDSSGNFWLFGGFGLDDSPSTGYLNDLWEFNPATNEWAWMGGNSSANLPGVYGTLGVPAAGNIPGSRYIASNWTDSSGNLWLFGGWQFINERSYIAKSNDLWKYQPSPTIPPGVPPFGNLDQAVDATTSSTTVGEADSLLVYGWAADKVDRAPLSNVKVYIDGTLAGPLTLGIARSDVAAASGNPAYTYSGYKLLYPASTLSLGAHTATVAAIDSGGNSTTFGPLTFTVATSAGAGPPFGNLDHAIDSTTSSTTVGEADSLLVYGWAADKVDGAPLSNVKVYIDGTLAGTPILGIARPDVALALGDAAFTDSGYRLLYPAATLSLGAHTASVVAIDSGGNSTTFGPLTFTVAASAGASPFGNLELAVDNATFKTTVAPMDSLLVSGWAADQLDGAPLSDVKVYIDRALAGTPVLGIARPDVAAAYGNPAYTNSGYKLVFPASTLSLGAHVVTVVAVDSGGRSTKFGPLQIEVVSGPPFGDLDQAIDSTTSSTTVGEADSLLVYGWAADKADGAPLSDVKVYIDGALAGTPVLGIARSDVAAASGDSAYTYSGYKLLYPASTLSLGAHTATVVAIDSGGKSTTFGPLTFTVATSAGAGPPFGNLDLAVDQTTNSSTVAQADSLHVWGWAADQADGAPLGNVKVYIDGTLAGIPNLGLARQDVAETLDNTAYTYSGYDLIYSASTLSLGEHAVTVVAIDSGGRSTVYGPLYITVVSSPDATQ